MDLKPYQHCLCQRMPSGQPALCDGPQAFTEQGKKVKLTPRRGENLYAVARDWKLTNQVLAVKTLGDLVRHAIPECAPPAPSRRPPSTPAVCPIVDVIHALLPNPAALGGDRPRSARRALLVTTAIVARGAERHGMRDTAERCHERLMFWVAGLRARPHGVSTVVGPLCGPTASQSPGTLRLKPRQHRDTRRQGVGCAEPCEAQPTVGASCASYRQHNLRVWKFAEIA